MPHLPNFKRVPYPHRDAGDAAAAESAGSQHAQHPHLRDLSPGAVAYLDWLRLVVHQVECSECAAQYGTFPAPPPQARTWLRTQIGQPRFETYLRRVTGLSGSPEVMRQALDIYDALTPPTYLEPLESMEAPPTTHYLRPPTDTQMPTSASTWAENDLLGPESTPDTNLA